MLVEGMEIVQVIKSYFKNNERRLFFDASFLTFCLLILMSAIVTCQQYFGNPIECMQDNNKDVSIPESVVNKFCFISETYVSVDFKGPTNDSRKRSFYPWVPVVLLFQGLSFLLPQNFWSYIDAGFFLKCLKDRNSVLIDDNKLQPLARYLAMRMSSFVIWSVGYVLSEVIFALIVVINFYFTDVFLGGGFMEYGFEIFYNNQSVFATSFPLVTRCIFRKFGPSGTIEKRDALCVMTLNTLNEKIYLFLWFWFFSLLILSMLICLCRLYVLIVILMRKQSSCLMRMALIPNLDYDGVLILLNKLTVTDWILIQQLAKTMNPKSYSKLLEYIVFEMNEFMDLSEM